MIGTLNRLVDEIERAPGETLDVAAFASAAGTTEYHLRRMFSTLAGVTLGDYIRRRRMTLAASEVVAGRPLLDVAVAFGYGSAEAFTRAFTAVHRATPRDVRTSGGPLSAQSVIRFRITVEGTNTMDTRIIERPAFALVGHAVRVPLIHVGINPHIQAHITSLPAGEHLRLKTLSGTEPAGLLQVTDDVDADSAEGSELTYLHGVAVSATAEHPADLDVIDVAPGNWAVFRSTGPHPEALQTTWAATASEWFPSNPWRLRPGPSIVAILDRVEDFSTATTELWLPIEPA